MADEIDGPRPYRWISSSLVGFVGFFVVDLLFKVSVTRSLVHALCCVVVVQVIGRLMDRSRPRL